MAGTQPGMHQGISFDNWLNIFLDYAIGLAMKHQREEAYQVCEAAKDSVVFQASNHEFLIHIAWTGMEISSHIIIDNANKPSLCHLHQRRREMRRDC